MTGNIATHMGEEDVAGTPALDVQATGSEGSEPCAVFEGAQSLVPGCVAQGYHGKGKGRVKGPLFWPTCADHRHLKRPCNHSALYPAPKVDHAHIDPLEELRAWVKSPENQLRPDQQPRSVTLLQQDRFTDGTLRDANTYAADELRSLNARIWSLTEYGEREPYDLVFDRVGTGARFKLACFKPAVIKTLPRYFLEKTLKEAAEQIEYSTGEAEAMRDKVLEERMHLARNGNDGEMEDLLRLGLVEICDGKLVAVPQ